MGINSSKSQTVLAAQNKDIELKVKKDSNSNIESMSLQRLLDPRSPDVNRTPLPEILTNRFNNCVLNDEVVKTPVNQFRKKLLNYSSNDSKLLDPRSPSQFIPRTPLNLSFDESKLTKTDFSLEYTGILEDLSVRNFNERLANITFDDPDIEIESISKAKLDEIQEEEDNNGVDDDENAVEKKAENKKVIALSSEIQDDPRSPSHAIQRTPLILTNAVSKIQSIVDDEKNISPIINETADRKANPHQFSSTPIVQQTGGQLKLLLKKNIARKAEIFEDEVMNIESVEVIETNLARNKSIEVLVTPVKHMAKLKEKTKPRTPLGVLNRRSKSVENLSQLQQSKCGQQENIILNTYQSKENDENVYFTPQSKPKTSLKKLNSGFKSKIQIHYD